MRRWVLALVLMLAACGTSHQAAKIATTGTSTSTTAATTTTTAVQATAAQAAASPTTVPRAPAHHFGSVVRVSGIDSSGGIATSPVPIAPTSPTVAPSASPGQPPATTGPTTPVTSAPTTTAAPPATTAPPPTATTVPHGVNLISSPGLEDGATGWRSHGAEFPSQTGLVWGRQTGWAHSGSWSMRQSATAGSTPITPNIYGVAGSYLAPPIACSAGDTFTLTAWVNNLVELPAGSPGLWLEMFWSHDGAGSSQTNGPTLGAPAPAGVQHLSMTGTCPSGANVVQVLCVGATNTPGTTVDFYTDDVSLVRN